MFIYKNIFLVVIKTEKYLIKCVHTIIILAVLHFWGHFKGQFGNFQVLVCLPESRSHFYMKKETLINCKIWTQI
jgi:hypothetical protein